MSPTRIAINGFGRIGRCALRLSMNDPQVEFVGINDLFDVPTMAHLLKYDSVFGRADLSVEATENALIVNGKTIPVTKETDPSKLPWKRDNVDVVLECTGKFVDPEKAKAHLTAGAKKVIISAPAKGECKTFVIGINHTDYNHSTDHIISNASCTTNCLAPVAKVLNDCFGIERGFMTTIHSYTNDQRLLDGPHKDWRRARAAAVSQIPTTTGAAKAVGLVLPELKGKLDGYAMRVPTPNVSCVDLVCIVKKPAKADEINAAFKKASESSLKGVLAYTEEQLVSCDFIGTSVSSTVDATYTKANDNLIKVLAWYDNEWGFTSRMMDLAKYIGEKL